MMPMTERLTIKDVESLKLRFPYMFAGPVVSICYYKGWFPDFVDLCFELDGVLGEYRAYFYWNQIKEKFGSYRMYFEFRRSLESAKTGLVADGDGGAKYVMPPALVELRADIRRRISETSIKMFGKCCVCGEAATVANHGGWTGVLCTCRCAAETNTRGCLS